MAFKSTKSKDYVQEINKLEKPTYSSQYGGMINDTLDKIINKQPFTYDFNADPLYQNYKDQYVKLGKEAAMNAAASVSALTGGYGNSYGATAASQANQQYLTELNDKIPELYNAALNRYQMEVDNNYKQFNALQSEENRLYGQHRDDVSDYYNDWGNLESGYSTALNQENWQKEFDYQKERDAIADEQWQKNFDFNSSRAGVSDTQWNQNFAYQKERDAVADAQWQKNYELALKKARSSGSGSSGSSKKSSSSTTGSNKINGSSQRSIEYSNNERINTILTNARKADDPLAYLEEIATTDPKFTLGDLEFFMNRLGL